MNNRRNKRRKEEKIMVKGVKIKVYIIIYRKWVRKKGKIKRNNIMGIKKVNRR